MHVLHAAEAMDGVGKVHGMRAGIKRGKVTCFDAELFVAAAHESFGIALDTSLLTSSFDSTMLRTARGSRMCLWEDFSWVKWRCQCGATGGPPKFMPLASPIRAVRPRAKQAAGNDLQTRIAMAGHSQVGPV